MDRFRIFWINVLFVLSQCKDIYTADPTTSSLKTQMFSIRFDVDMLKWDSAKIKAMIGQLKETIYVERKCSNADYKETKTREDIEITTEVRDSSSRDHGHVTQLVKAFQDEKIFHREKMDELIKYQQVLLQNIENLEKQNTALAEKHTEAMENFKAYTKKNEIDAEMSKNRTTETVERVTDLESDIASVNESFIVRTEDIKSDMETCKTQLNVLKGRVGNLETNHRLVQDRLRELDGLKQVKECDSPWLYNKVLNTCFLFISKKRNWRQTVSFCNNHTARLVEIPNAQKSEQVKRMFEESGYEWGEGGKWGGFWTGGYKSGYLWMWQGSQTSFGWTNWYQDEPKNDQYLTVMVNDRYFRWDDTRDWYTKPFICEKTIT